MKKGYLGISGRTVSDEMAAYNMPNGVYVAEVSKNGAADKAGIQKGDIITSINNMEVRSIESLQKKPIATKKGTQVEIILQRSDSGTYKEKESESYTARFQFIKRFKFRQIVQQ